jgi:hypothetical protein
VCRWLVTASVVLSSPFLVTLKKEALSSSETSGLTRATLRNIPEGTILHSHRRGNLKSYIVFYSYVEFRKMKIAHKSSNYWEGKSCLMGDKLSEYECCVIYFAYHSLASTSYTLRLIRIYNELNEN